MIIVHMPDFDYNLTKIIINRRGTEMKRICCFVLATVMVMLCISSCSNKHFSFEQESHENDLPDNDYITRAEWAEVIGTFFGMDSCLSDESYFTDVTPSNASFAYIQACTEWEIFEVSSGNFNPNDIANVGFVIESAIKAAEIDYSKYDTILDYAQHEGILSEKADSKATKQFACKVAEWALNKYQSKEFVPYENVKYKDTIIPIPDAAVDEKGNICTADNNLNVGDVIIIPGDSDNPYGLARKVSNISYNENGKAILETKEPEINDLYDDLDFACIGTITDPAMVRPAEGVTLDGVVPAAVRKTSNGIHGTTLAYHNPDANNIAMLSSKGTDLSFSVKLAKGGKLTFSPAYNEIKADIERGNNSEAEKEAAKSLLDKTGLVKPLGENSAKIHDKNGDVQTVKATDKYSAGWELEGKIVLKNFYIETEFETKKAFGVPCGIKKFDYEIHYEVEPSLKLGGKLEEEITIATVPIPLGSSGITVDVEILAKASFNGNIEIGASISNTTNVKYSDTNGYKKTQTSQCEKSAELSGKLKIGFGGKATLKALGIELIDFKLDIGFGVETSGKFATAIRFEGVLYKDTGGVARLAGAKEENIFCIDAAAYFPTVSLSIGNSGTLANKLGIKVAWKIMDKSGATFKSNIIPLHYEWADWGRGFVDECTLDTLQIYSEEDISDQHEEDSKEAASLVGNDILDISQYAISLNIGEQGTISVTSLPHGYVGFDIEWNSEDNSIVNVTDIKADENSSMCQIQAVGAGITSITVDTHDGKHPLRCSIIVKEDGTVEFSPMD